MQTTVLAQLLLGLCGAANGEQQLHPKSRSGPQTPLCTSLPCKERLLGLQARGRAAQAHLSLAGLSCIHSFKRLHMTLNCNISLSRPALSIVAGSCSLGQSYYLRQHTHTHTHRT